MGLFVLALLITGSYLIASKQWRPRFVAATTTGTPPNVTTTPAHWEQEWGFVSWQSVPGAILVGLGIWIFYVMFFGPAVLTKGQTLFKGSTSQWTFRAPVGDKVGQYVLDADGKDLVKEVAQQQHENRYSGTSKFAFAPESVKFTIRTSYNPWSFYSINFYEVESAITGKATWEEEEIDDKGVKKTVKKDDNAFTVRGIEAFSASSLDDLLHQGEFVKTSGGGITATTGRRYVINKLFSGAMKGKS